MNMTRTLYQAFEENPEYRKLLRQEEFILEVTESILWALKKQNVSKAELAVRLGRSKSFVSQLLGGGRNLTLRTIADMFDAIDCRPKMVPCPRWSSSVVMMVVDGGKHDENWSGKT